MVIVVVIVTRFTDGMGEKSHVQGGELSNFSTRRFLLPELLRTGGIGAPDPNPKHLASWRF